MSGLDEAGRSFQMQQSLQRLISGPPKREKQDNTRHVDPFFLRDYKPRTKARSTRRQKRK